jgi:hypothetical protein
VQLSGNEPRLLLKDLSGIGKNLYELLLDLFRTHVEVVY